MLLEVFTKYATAPLSETHACKTYGSISFCTHRLASVYSEKDLLILNDQKLVQKVTQGRPSIQRSRVACSILRDRFNLGYTFITANSRISVHLSHGLRRDFRRWIWPDPCNACLSVHSRGVKGKCPSTQLT